MLKFNKPIFIAELCCNHMGSLDIAKVMIDLASEAGVDVVKFQKRDIEEWTNRKPNVYNNKHPNPSNSFGNTYKEHREALEFSFDEHKILKDYCDKKNVEYSASVWDIKSAKEICSLNPFMIKVASPCNSNFELLEWLCNNYFGEIHLSLGMTSHDEIERIVNLFVDNKRNEDLVLYACTSGYPVEFEDMCILEIHYLLEKYGSIVKKIGFSGHHIGTTIDVAAYTLGASVIERHFTIDKDLKGTDQKVALTKNEFAKLVNDVNDVYKALKYKDKDILDVEVKNKEKLKW